MSKPPTATSLKIATPQLHKCIHVTSPQIAVSSSAIFITKTKTRTITISNFLPVEAQKKFTNKILVSEPNRN